MRLTTHRPYIVEFLLTNFKEEGRRPGEVLQEWLRDNARNKFEILFCNQVVHFTQAEALNMSDRAEERNVNFIFFESQRDAVLFKMRWGGA